jgi:hypothetical protein
MGFFDDLAMGFGLKPKTKDFEARTARTMEKNNNPSGAQQYRDNRGITSSDIGNMSASSYSGPFESLYEEHEALQGNRGNQAAHMAAQAGHSRGLMAKGMTDTSAFGTSRDLLGNDRYETAAQNPLNPNFQAPAPQQTAREAAIMSRGMGQGSGGILPSVFGSGAQRSGSTNQSGIGQFFSDVGNAYRNARSDLGMGIGNLLSGGAFTDDYDTKLQGLVNMGYSAAEADDYIRRTRETAERQNRQEALYGYGPDRGPGIDTSQPVGDVGVLDPEGPEQPEDPITRIPAIHIAPIRMAQGGLMSLRRR